MVRYPDTITLASILIDPHWGNLATRCGDAGLAVFHNEIRHRLRIPYEAYTATTLSSPGNVAWTNDASDKDPDSQQSENGQLQWE
jgi:hypothetical protein